MRKLPYGQINFEKIITQNYLYVDKTQFIEKLEETPDLDTSIYLRPGRFGKSLFTSMLTYYYGIEHKDKFEKLFGNLYIGKHPTENRNSYYMLNFDFSALDVNAKTTLEQLEDVFMNKVIEGIKDFIGKYNVQIDYEKYKTPASLIGNFFIDFRNLVKGAKIYIIIDEYDNFTNGILKGDADSFAEIVSGEGFVKAFYSRIKEEIKIGTVEKFFAAGIAPITLDSMTTGFNIATDITKEPDFVSMCGFTHEEAKRVIEEVFPEKTESEINEIYEKMIQYYNGYRFSEYSETTTFNSTLVLYYLKMYLKYGMEPQEKVDVNIVANYEKLGNLITLKNNQYSKEILEDLMQGKELRGKITRKFNLKIDMSKDDMLSILFYFGYATIDKYNAGKVYFKIPNYVMREIYSEYFMYLLENEGLRIDTSKIEDAIDEIAFEGKISKLCQLVEEYLSYIGNIAWQRYDEKYVKGYMHAIMLTTSMFNTYLEFNVRHNGYIDVAIFKNGTKGVKYQAIIEVKYLKKGENNQENITAKRKEAFEQIERYMEDERLPKDDLKKFIVLFIGEKLEFLEEV